MQEKLVKSLKKFSNYIILILLVLLVTSMFLGTGHILVLFFQSILSPDPYPFLVNIKDLHVFFSVLLVMLVGHELFKSITLLLNHENIPVKSILKIATIAIANKIITLDLEHLKVDMLLGLSALLLSIGITFFFFSKESEA